MHTHTTAGVAVASLQSGLSQSNFYSAQLHQLVAYHEFEGITVHAEEGPRVLKSIGNKPAVILKNHGLLSWGATVPEAFAVLWTLQRACEIQMATLAMGDPIPVPEPVAAKCTRDSLQFDRQQGGVGVDLFNALIRQVDRIDPGYRA
jgi:ribulose-5-phosphate 4-epimerase/fuculose-1-phosphate aldolase